MCSCDFDEGPLVFQEAHVRARKPHVCCECRQSIPKAATYERASGLWRDGGWATYRTCLSCAAVRDDLSRRKICSAFGQLRDALSECGEAEYGPRPPSTAPHVNWSRGPLLWCERLEHYWFSRPARRPPPAPTPDPNGVLMEVR